LPAAGIYDISNIVVRLRWAKAMSVIGEERIQVMQGGFGFQQVRSGNFLHGDARDTVNAVLDH
jgi:hypothetical protein